MVKYEQVANDLLRRIREGEFDDGGKLPTEEKLVAHYHVSRYTIRSALKTLSSKGAIYSRQGSGFYIRKLENTQCISITGTNGLQHDFPKSQFMTKVLSLEIVEADDELSKIMLCDLKTPIYKCKRLRIVDNKKYALELCYYNKNIVPYLNKDIAEKSIYTYLKQDLGLKFGFADKYIDAISLNKEEASLLDLHEGEPGLVIRDAVYLEDGMLFNASRVIYNYQYAHFYATAMHNEI